jgi:putative tryptophan/tyrosine transport system substrate-binding protein
LDQSGQECDQDDSCRHGGRGKRPCRGRPDWERCSSGWQRHRSYKPYRKIGWQAAGAAQRAVPKLARVAVLYEPATPANVLEVNEDLPIAARALKLTVQPWEIRTADGFDRVFAALNKERPDGLYVAGSPLLNNNQKRIAGLALKSRLPSVYQSSEAVDAGGLMYYGADLTDSYRRVAYYVDKILKGAKPADLPVEQPKKFELVINLKTAKQIGLTIPPNVLARSDRVIR